MALQAESAITESSTPIKSAFSKSSQLKNGEQIGKKGRKFRKPTHKTPHALIFYQYYRNCPQDHPLGFQGADFDFNKCRFCMWINCFFLLIILCELILQIEIKRVLESLYGFEVEKVRTLNRDGKKKKMGGILMARADYKKAYVTLRNPLSINPDLFPIREIEEDKANENKQSKSSIVEDPEAAKKSHWLDEKRDNRRYKTPEGRTFGRRTGRGDQKAATGSGAKFPWTSMTSLGR